MWVKIYSLYLLMSVASKTKTKIFTTVVLSFVSALSVLPTWANATQGITQTSTVSPITSVNSDSSNQDLLKLRSRLKERFSWVFTEARSLISQNTTILPTDTPQISSSSRSIDLRQWILSSSENQDFFTDIANDPYRTYINRLAAYHVLTLNQKFFPQNYFSINDFMVLLGKLYKQPLPQNILSLTSSDGLMTKWILQQIMYALPTVQKITVDGNPYDKLIRAEWSYYLVCMFDVPILEPEQSSNISLANAFIDIDDTPFAADINILANLGIVNTQSAKFYPDNYLRHYDFIILFINALLIAQQQSLSPTSPTSVFADVDSSASYLAQLIYAADRGLIDHLVRSVWGQLYFDPDDFVTKDEVYHTLSAPTNVQLIHNDNQATEEKISRAELAELLVNVFQLQAKQSSSSILTWNDLDTGTLWVLLKLKTLLSMI